MGTRGCYGFRLRGKDYLSYNHFDSYPAGLGVNLVTEFASFILAGKSVGLTEVEMLDTIRDTVEKIRLLPESQELYDELHPQLGQLGHWLREEEGRMMDYSNFMLDSLFCEWAYVLNLDTERFEVYEGFNKDREAGGRYADTNPDDQGYVGVARVWSVPIRELIEDYVGVSDQVTALDP